MPSHYFLRMMFFQLGGLDRFSYNFQICLAHYLRPIDFRRISLTKSKCHVSPGNFSALGFYEMSNLITIIRYARKSSLVFGQKNLNKDEGCVGGGKVHRNQDNRDQM